MTQGSQRLLGLLCAAAAVFPLPAAALEAGAAKVEITGPVGAPLNGYGDRMGRSSIGVHDALWARALYLDDGDTPVLLVGTDLCMIHRELRQRVLELAPAHVPREHVILTATHTHNAQGGMHPHLPMRLVTGRFMPEVLESTAQGIAKAMREAYEKRQRATIGFGTAKQQALSVNRRQTNGPIDEQIGVIRVENADGEPIAIAVNFAAHPTSVPEADHYSYSADYPGFFYQHLEQLTSPNCVGLFLNGAEGNQTIANPENKQGWERTESVGRLLAGRVKEVANGIVCGEAFLTVGYAEPTLPRTIAAQIMPDRAPLQTLEINDLLLTFLPGEPCVEIGLELRKRALERGYKTQMTVGLANDYLLYFIPREQYPRFHYESAMNLYGPGIDQWIYREFARLMGKGESPVELEPPPPAQVQTEPGALRIALSGTPYGIGVQRGRAFGESIRANYRAKILQRLLARDAMPRSGAWALWPPFLDPAPLALPALAIAARPLLEGVPDPIFDEIVGIADGAELPFDAVWLLQNAAHLAAFDDREALFTTPLCTMAAIAGERSGGGLLIGRNLDWADTEEAVISEVTPESGRGFVQVGFPWNAGVFTGMNDAGIVLCAERIATLGHSGIKNAPIEFLLRGLLQSAERLDTVIETLRTKAYLHGYHVLAAGPTEKGWDAAVIEFGERVSVRHAEQGILLGARPDGPLLDAAARTRYGRMAALLAGAAPVSRANLESALADQEPDETGLAQIWNDQTRHSVIFEPESGRLHASFPGLDGRPGPYTTVTLARRAAP